MTVDELNEIIYKKLNLFVRQWKLEDSNMLENKSHNKKHQCDNECQSILTGAVKSNFQSY